MDNLDAQKTSNEHIQSEEYKVKLAEFSARKAEAQAKLSATSAPWWHRADPLVLAVAAGVFTLAANIGVAWYNAKNSLAQEFVKASNALDLEREKAKSTLIVQAVSTDDAEKAQRNLLFFLESGLLPDKDNKIREAAKKYGPVLPAPAGTTRTPPTTAEQYVSYFWSANLRPELLERVDRSVTIIVNARTRLEKVASTAASPWYAIGAFWMLETGGSFTSHLHNGDPLTDRTVHVPAGRPTLWPPPEGQDPWEYSAADAVQLYNLSNIGSADIGEVLFRLEGANGRGYQRRGLFSPYIWAGTDLYDRGKYVADATFDPDAVAIQPGAAAILHRMHDKKIIDLNARPAVGGGR